MTKTIIEHWLEARSTPSDTWKRLGEGLTYQQCRDRACFLGEGIEWRIIRAVTKTDAVAWSPKPKKRRQKLCKHWPNCGCIVQGTEKDCEQPSHGKLSLGDYCGRTNA